MSGICKIMKGWKIMSKIANIIDKIVFIATTLAIAGVFYEGMELEWFSIVGVLILCMDYSFLIATVIHLINDRKSKWMRVHIFSLIILIVAIVMKVLGITYPSISLVLWYFYIWFLYGIINVRSFNFNRNT